MIFITKSGNEIKVPNDYTYSSLEIFAKEIYYQGREDAINECINAIKNRWVLWHLGVVKAIIDVLEELKENDNDLV